VGVAGGEARQGEDDGGGECDEGACGGGVPSPETMASAHADGGSDLRPFVLCLRFEASEVVHTSVANECAVYIGAMMAAGGVRGLHGRRSQSGGGWPASWWKKIEKLVHGPLVRWSFFSSGRA